MSSTKQINKLHRRTPKKDRVRFESIPAEQRNPRPSRRGEGGAVPLHRRGKSTRVLTTDTTTN